MKYAKNPEFETTIFDAKTYVLLPPILDIWGKYTHKENITAQWLENINWKIIHIRQEWEKVVVEHTEKVPNTCSQITSFQKTRFIAKDFHSVIGTFKQIWFSLYREEYKKFRYSYVSHKHAEIGKIQFNFDTYEFRWEKSAPVLKIVAETKEGIYKIANSMKLDPSELRWIGPLDAFNYIYPEIKNI